MFFLLLLGNLYILKRFIWLVYQFILLGEYNCEEGCLTTSSHSVHLNLKQDSVTVTRSFCSLHLTLITPPRCRAPHNTRITATANWTILATQHKNYSYSKLSSSSHWLLLVTGKRTDVDTDTIQILAAWKEQFLHPKQSLANGNSRFLATGNRTNLAI